MTSRLSSTGEWFKSYKKELFQFGGAFAIYEAFNWIYDKLIFSVTLWVWGPVWGAIIPTIGALIINAFVFWLYDHMQVDWLRAHALRELADKENKSNLEKLLTWHLVPRTSLRDRILGELRFAALLVPLDPVIVAVYYREGHFKGVSGRDWFVIVKATLVACVLWLVIMEPLVGVVRVGWHFLGPHILTALHAL